MEIFASFGSDAKKGRPTPCFWIKDHFGGFDAITNEDNIGYAARKSLVVHSRKVSMMGHLHIDIVAQ